MNTLEWCSTCEGPVEISDEHIVQQATRHVKVVTDSGRTHFLLQGRKRTLALKKYANSKSATRTTVHTPVVAEAAEAPPQPIAVVKEVVAPPPIAEASDWVKETFRTEPQRPQPPAPPEEVFVPDSETWFYAEVESNRDNSSYLVAALDNGERALVPYGKVSKSPGSHRCRVGMPVGTKFEIRMERARKGRSEYVAIDARCENDTPEIFETATLTYWSGAFGTAQRECGCFIFAWANRDDNFNLEIGDKVEIQIERNDQKGWAGIIQGVSNGI
jgi:hypothetical protein